MIKNSTFATCEIYFIFDTMPHFFFFLIMTQKKLMCVVFFLYIHYFILFIIWGRLPSKTHHTLSVRNFCLYTSVFTPFEILLWKVSGWQILRFYPNLMGVCSWVSQIRQITFYFILFFLLVYSFGITQYSLQSPYQFFFFLF